MHKIPNQKKFLIEKNSRNPRIFLYWQKISSMRLISRNSSSKLVGETPHHEHTTNILRQQAKSMEKNIIKKYAALPGTSTKAMLCEISQNIPTSGPSSSLL